MKRLILLGSMVLNLAWFAPPAVAADKPAGPATLTIASAAPPPEVAEPVGALLEPTVIRLADKDQPFFEFWFRKEIPLAEKPSDDASALAAVKEGTLLGVVKVGRQRYDFKDEEIPLGVYLLRLGLQPEDGNHQGTAPTRTFAMLLPADKDREANFLPEHEQLVKVSSTINAAEHPSILNLQPIEETKNNFPRLAEQGDGQFKVLCLRLPAKVEGRNEPVMLTFALVYEGKGNL